MGGVVDTERKCTEWDKKAHLSIGLFLRPESEKVF